MNIVEQNENFPHSVNNFWKSQNNLHYFNNSAFVICKTVMYAYYSSVITTISIPQRKCSSDSL